MGKAKTVKTRIANVSVRGDEVVVRVTNGMDEADIRFRYSIGSSGPDMTVDDGEALVAMERLGVPEGRRQKTVDRIEFGDELGQAMAAIFMERDPCAAGIHRCVHFLVGMAARSGVFGKGDGTWNTESAIVEGVYALDGRPCECGECENVDLETVCHAELLRLRDIIEEALSRKAGVDAERN